jgi:F420-non-reducing hydrogenase iron-sulfur subunit
MMKNGSQAQARITVFHCINVFAEGDAQPVPARDGIDLKFIKLPCSSLVKDVYILRAFEAGADAVAVLACPEGACRYVEGNLRAKKRVQRVQSLLDEIGLGADRLILCNQFAGDRDGYQNMIQEIRSTVASLGPNPAA